MFYKLLVPLCLARLVRGDHNLEDVTAEEPQFFESVSEVEALAPELEAQSVNATFGARYVGTGVKYGAHIERVVLSKCPRFTTYLPYFYDGLVVNSRAWTYKHEERFTSVAVADKSNEIISSSGGAYAQKKEYLYHTWEMLNMGKTSQDIRRTNPGKVYFWTWNAMQQIYFPLYMSSMATGTAYMLHLYPEPAFLVNPPSDSSFIDGLLWARGDQHRLYKIEIDLENMIKNLDNFSVPNYSKYISSWGVVSKNAGGSQKQVAYSDYRQVSLKATTLGAANEYICSDSPNTMDITWTQMRALLLRELSWL